VCVCVGKRSSQFPDEKTTSILEEVDLDGTNGTGGKTEVTEYVICGSAEELALTVPEGSTEGIQHQGKLDDVDMDLDQVDSTDGDVCGPNGREENKLCGRPPQYAPALHVDLLTLKLVSKSRVTWATSVQILVFLGLSVLVVYILGPMYVTDRCQRDRRQTHIIA